MRTVEFTTLKMANFKYTVNLQKKEELRVKNTSQIIAYLFSREANNQLDGGGSIMRSMRSIINIFFLRNKN